MHLGQTCVHYTRAFICVQESVCIHMYAQVLVCMCVLLCVCMCSAAPQAGGQGYSVGSGACRLFPTRSLGVSPHSGAAGSAEPGRAPHTHTPRAPHTPPHTRTALLLSHLHLKCTPWAQAELTGAPGRE